MKKPISALRSLNRSSVVKRLLLMIIPAILIPLGISGYFASYLGSDPFSVFIDGLHALTGLTHGQIALSNSILLVTLMIFFGRKYLGVGTVVLALTVGPLIDIFRTVLITAMYSDYGADIIVRIIVMLAGCIFLSVGIGMFIILEIGVGGIEWVVLSISDRFNFRIKYVKIGFDFTLVALGWLMGGLVGVGTILGVTATGPIIDKVVNILKKPVSNFAGPIRKE